MCFMMLNFKISLFLIILSLGIGCSDTGSRPNPKQDTPSLADTTKKEEKEFVPYEMDGSVDDDVTSELSGAGDLNGDGIADSVFLDVNPETHSARISFFFGKGNDQYDLFRMYELEDFWDELIPSLHGDTLSLCAYGTCYSFKFRDNDFYLAGYDFVDICCPNYRLDFDKKKLTFVLSSEDGIKTDTTYYRSIDIPKDRVPSSYTILDCFKKDWGYTSYEDSFLRPKIDSFVKIINRELIRPKFKIIDNDTLYAYKRIVGRHELSMLLDKKGVSKMLQLALESELSTLLSKDLDLPYSNILLVFDERRKQWEEYNESYDDENFLNKDVYWTERMCSYEDFVTYLIVHEHVEFENDRGLYDEELLTFDKNSGGYFCSSMLKKEKGLHQLLVDGLKKFYGTKSDEELLDRLSSKKIAAIPYPKNHPFLCNDSLFFFYQPYEITSVPGLLEFGVPMKEVLPYLTESGKAFLKIEK